MHNMAVGVTEWAISRRGGDPKFLEEKEKKVLDYF